MTPVNTHQEEGMTLDNNRLKAILKQHSTNCMLADRKVRKGEWKTTDADYQEAESLKEAKAALEQYIAECRIDELTKAPTTSRAEFIGYRQDRIKELRDE